MAGYEGARRFKPYGVTVNSVHPGIVATDIIDDLVPLLLTPFKGLIRRMMLSPEQGASATLRLVTDPGVSTTTGAYFVKDAETATSAVSYDLRTQQRIWNVSADHFGTAPTSTDTPPACVP